MIDEEISRIAQAILTEAEKERAIGALKQSAIWSIHHQLQKYCETHSITLEMKEQVKLCDEIIIQLNKS